MRQMLHFAFDAIKVFIIFTGCTILFYYGIIWLNQEYQEYHRYEKPKGTAVKVSAYHNQESTWLDRLIFFYHNGE